VARENSSNDSMPSWLVSSWSKMRLAWLLAGGVAVVFADAPGAVAVADDEVDAGVVALDGGVVAVGVDVLDEGAAADGVAVAADVDGVVVSACASCMSRVDARIALSAVAQAVPATPMAAAATSVASRVFKRAFIMDSSIDRIAAGSAA
jgi:hypothetical protein